MAISKDLFLSILSLDSYNRGYNEGTSGLGGVGERVGSATISTDALLETSTKDTAIAEGFYAVAYTVDPSKVEGLNDSLVNSYRGTDGGLGEFRTTDRDITRLGDFTEPQLTLASEFYSQVIQGRADVTLTGHSLGGHMQQA